MANTTPEQRARRGCHFIILLFAVLTGLNYMDGGTASLLFRIFGVCLIVAIIARLVIATDRQQPEPPEVKK
ncbi:MAG: hypothetical protein DWI55_01765 [Chloroflexi bacterium]|jgi:hypothetical protein|nr:MAG: hypothetical protein DWI55_01765 [Chloroflexota bacterium]